MDTPHTLHHPDALFLWFADGPEPAEVERCDDAGCAVCACAEPRPIVEEERREERGRRAA
jgi:hypothetical protein